MLSLIKVRRRFSKRTGLITTSVTAAAGVCVLVASFAAGTPLAFEPEAGSLAGCATPASNAAASGGAAVKFAACGTADTSDPTNLDVTGATIPDTNYPIPVGAIFMDDAGSDSNSGTVGLPVKTLNKAISLVPAGGTIVVRGGTYRDWYNTGGTTFATASKALTLQAYPHEQAWFDGADVKAAGSWTPDGAGHWSMTWATPSFCNGGYYTFPYNEQSGSAANPGSNIGPCTHYDNIGDATHPAAADPQMVFKNGAYVPEVSSLGAVTTNAFFYDQDLVHNTGTLYIGFDPAASTVEVAARPTAFISGAANTKVLGLGFKRYATNEYDNTTKAAVRIGGDGSMIENSVLKDNAGGALYVAAHSGVVNHVALLNNGFTALGSNGHQHSDGSADGLAVQNSLVDGNNSEYFGPNCTISCAAAGIKYGHMDGFTVKHNILTNNHGKANGFWCDLACSNGAMVNNVAHDNGGDGLMYEVSDTGIIASNLAYNNAGYGIRVVSANTKVYNNTLVNNTGSGGFWTYDDARTFGVGGWTDVGPDTTNVSFANNIVADSKNSNTLLRAQGKSATAPNTEPSQFFSLLDYNSYWRTSTGQNLMRWIPADAAETAYKSLAPWTAGTGFDAHSTDVSGGSDPFFTNLAGGDYTVRTNSTAYHSGTALPADVAAAMGTTTTAGQNRGALSWPGN